MQATENFREHLASRRGSPAHNPSLGLWATACSPNVVEVLSRSGFDWMMLDCEHSPRDLATFLQELRILEASPCLALVRVAWNDAVLLKRVLDLGADSVMVPMVNNAEEARAAIAAVHYPPKGQRGAASSTRATGYGRNNEGYFQKVNPFLIVQIETTKAVENLDEIADVEGVDALFFGPTDLSAAMGLLGQPSHPKVIETIAQAIPRVRKKGCYAGVLSPGMLSFPALIQAKPDFISVASDLVILASNADQLAITARKIVEDAQ